MKSYTCRVVVEQTGTWKHAEGSDFLFCYIPNDLDDDTKAALGQAFEDALPMASTIKEAVKETSGQVVVNGLYLQDQAAMTMAMNSIQGMGETSADQRHQEGDGTAVEINGQFFAAVLAGLGGDIAPMSTYLKGEMGKIQAEAKKTGVTHNFGTVMGLISLMPDLNVPVTTFQYVYSAEQTMEWFESINCASVAQWHYNYDFTVVNYNYVKPTRSFMLRRAVKEVVQQSSEVIQRAY